MVVIKVPKTPKRAFNTKRPPSDLLKAQIAHLEAAAAGAAPEARAAKRMPKTEGEAAKYIASLTRQLGAPAERPSDPETPSTAPVPRKKKVKTKPTRAKKRRGR